MAASSRLFSCTFLQKIKKTRTGSFSHGGDGEDRTLDLLHAKQALSQLSYVPMNDINYITEWERCKDKIIMR